MPERDSLRVFISYSHSRYDADAKDRILTHFEVLKRLEGVATWTDDEIGGGQPWKRLIEEALNAAAAAVLLISPDFLASPFITSTEAPRVLERRQSERMIIYPVLMRACSWKRIPWLEKMQMLPKDALPVWREEGKFADDELATITDKLWVDLSNELAWREAAKQGVENQAKAELELERFRAVTQEALDARRETGLNSFEGAISIMPPSEAEKQRQQMIRWQILQDSQTKMFDIAQSGLTRKAKITDGAMKKWEEYVRQA